MLPRRAKLADELGGHRIEAGTDVLLCVYSLHRDPGAWSEPERFRPERFLPGGEGVGSPSFLPFSIGPRRCPGAGLGMAEIERALAAIVPRVRIALVDARDPEPSALLTLVPRGGLRARATLVSA
jgi:enediyne biosynthesis protein E7